MRSLLFLLGFRFRLCQKNLLEKPDIVLKKFKTVIFVHGCFWHGHENCKNARIPKNNIKFWKNKIERNKQRFAKVSQQLQEQGWKVVVVWKCEISKNFEDTMKKLVETITTKN